MPWGTMLLHDVILNQPQGSGARPPQAETSNYKQNKSFFSLNSFIFFFTKTWSQAELNELTRQMEKGVMSDGKMNRK